MLSSKLRDIANKVFQLGEEYPEEKLVRKAVRSPQMRFSAKVEAKDVTKLP